MLQFEKYTIHPGFAKFDLQTFLLFVQKLKDGVVTTPTLEQQSAVKDVLNLVLNTSYPMGFKGEIQHTAKALYLEAKKAFAEFIALLASIQATLTKEDWLYMAFNNLRFRAGLLILSSDTLLPILFEDAKVSILTSPILPKKSHSESKFDSDMGSNITQSLAALHTRRSGLEECSQHEVYKKLCADILAIIVLFEVEYRESHSAEEEKDFEAITQPLQSCMESLQRNTHYSAQQKATLLYKEILKVCQIKSEGPSLQLLSKLENLLPKEMKLFLTITKAGSAKIDLDSIVLSSGKSQGASSLR